MKSAIRKIISVIALCAIMLSGCGSASTSQGAETVQEVTSVRVSETFEPAPTPIPTIRPFDHNDISMKRVESSSLALVGYDSDYSVLKVQFKDSGEY